MHDASAGQGATLGRRAAGAAAAAPDPAPSPDGPGGARARRINRLTGLLLLAAAAVVLVPTSPVLLYAAGVGVPRPPMQSAGKIGRMLRRSPAVAPPWAHDQTAEDDAPRLRLPDVEDHDGEPPDAPARLRVGVAPRGLTLLDEPSQGGSRVGTIPAGEVVMILREAGGWALIAQNTDEGVIMGWARRSEIAVR